jgi:hypothetical protein
MKKSANLDHAYPVPGAGLSIPPCFTAVNTEIIPLIGVLVLWQGRNAPEEACIDRLGADENQSRRVENWLVFDRGGKFCEFRNRFIGNRCFLLCQPKSSRLSQVDNALERQFVLKQSPVILKQHKWKINV